MKRIALLLIVSLIACVGVHAQNPKIEKSESFDEPEYGWAKVLLLKNGNTFYFHFTKKEGIEITVFDKSRKIVSHKMITSDLWAPKQLTQSIVEGLYEINGEPVLFLAQFDGREPTLYRLRFDPFNGDMVKEEAIGSMPKLKLFGGSTLDEFFVEKDPLTDYYAVIYFNGYANARDERIKVVHYDGSHKVINLAYYDSPDESFKYLSFIGAVVDGNKCVYISTYGAASAKGKGAHVFVSKLNATDSIFINRTLDFTEEFRDTKSIMYYNHTSNMIQLLTLSFTSGSWGTGHYLSFLSYIDPSTLTLKGVKLLAGEKMDEYAHKTLNIDKNYQGMPQQMIINRDNSTTILSEEMTQETVVNQYGGVVAAATMLGGIGLTELNEDGTERNGYVIIKTQKAGGIVDPLYMAYRRKGKWAAGIGYAFDFNTFMSYDYISTDKNRYIIFNDNTKNFDKDEDDRHRAVTTNVKKMNTVCYTLNGPSLNKSFLFGNPENEDNAKSCFIEASDYQQATGTYATIMIERNGKDRDAKMVWMSFE